MLSTVQCLKSRHAKLEGCATWSQPRLSMHKLVSAFKLCTPPGRWASSQRCGLLLYAFFATAGATAAAQPMSRALAAALAQSCLLDRHAAERPFLLSMAETSAL